MLRVFGDILKNIFFMLGYFGNVNSFPKALTKKEEDELFIKWKSEEDERARDKLIEHNLRLVAYVAKKFSKERKDIDDIISIGTIGLIKAINSFDIEKSIRLATYVDS